MDESSRDNFPDFRNRIEATLKSKIDELEKLKNELEMDTGGSIGDEHEQNVNLLIATANLLDQLKQTLNNITGLK